MFHNLANCAVLYGVLTDLIFKGIMTLKVFTQLVNGPVLCSNRPDLQRDYDLGGLFLSVETDVHC